VFKRIAAGAIALALIVVLAAAGWYYRPWSDYSPARITALDDPAEYPQTFQRMADILPAAPIAATAPAAFPLGEVSLPQSYLYDGQVRSLDEYFARGDVTGFAVLKDGVLVNEAYFQGAGPDTTHTSWSVAKSFVATLIAQAMQEGLIDSLDDPASMYAPQYAGSDYGDTSLRHLLMMSAGMDFQEEYSPDRESDVRPLFFNAFILRRDVDEMVSEIERDREPGQDLHYTSPNSQVLSAVVRGVYDDSLATIVEDKLWGPLGMTHDASWLQNRPGDDGQAIGYCCLQATTPDFARLGELYRLDGVWNGERLLPEGWVQSATIPNAPFQEPGATRYGGRGYALHFWVPEGYNGEFFAAGVYGQYVWVDTLRGVVIAQNAGDENWGEISSEAYAVFRAVAEHVSPIEARFEAVALEIRDAILARETGLSPADDGDTAQAPPEPAPEPATPEGGEE
jgi:CubicO group peptidase (beta-lactamase class C family)